MASKPATKFKQHKIFEKTIVSSQNQIIRWKSLNYCISIFKKFNTVKIYRKIFSLFFLKQTNSKQFSHNRLQEHIINFFFSF